MPLHIVVLNEHLLTDMLCVELIGHDIRALSDDLIFDLIFLANDRSPWIQLAQVVHHSVLDVNIHLGEDI